MDGEWLESVWNVERERRYQTRANQASERENRHSLTRTTDRPTERERDTLEPARLTHHAPHSHSHSPIPFLFSSFLFVSPPEPHFNAPLSILVASYPITIPSSLKSTHHTHILHIPLNPPPQWKLTARAQEDGGSHNVSVTRVK